MRTHNDTTCEDNIARLNAFLDQFPDGDCDPDFDDTAEYFDRELAGLRFDTDND